jgi:signal transduction histidine kinase
MNPLDRLRLRLTAWYVGTFAGTLLLLGLGLFLVLSRQISRELDRSLRETTREVLRMVRIRESEGASSPETLADAVDALEIRDRPLFLFDGAGRPVMPREADPRIRAAALRAARTGEVQAEFTTGTGQRWRLYGERFAAEDGKPYVTVAIADLAELEDRTLRLIEAFLAAGLLALVLTGAGGFYLARKSVRPVEAVMEQMRRFMADAAHELRTPLAVLRGRAEVAVQHEREPAAYVAALGEITREAGRLGTIVENLLILARADAGQQPALRERLYLDDVAGDAVAAAGVLAAARGVHIELGRYDEAPVTGDAALIRQLLMVLLDNAVKFTPPGGSVTVDVSVEEGHPTVAVEDTGIGVAPADLPHVFERFYRADPARERTGGAGLGLSIARWIAEQHGARVALEPREGGGTRAVAVFPPAM